MCHTIVELYSIWLIRVSLYLIRDVHTPFNLFIAGGVVVHNMYFGLLFIIVDKTLGKAAYV